MAIDTTTIAWQLKQVYGDKINDLFNRQVMTYNMFMKSNRLPTIRPGGAGFYFACRQADIESVGARAENAYLPEPLEGDGVQGYIKPKLVYASLRLSGLAVESGKTNLEAFANVQGDAVANVYKSLITDLNRQCWGDGTGLLATTTAAVTPGTTSASDTFTATMANDRGVRYLRKGMVVDLYYGAAIDTSASAIRIKSIAPSTRVVTFEANLGSYDTYHPLGTFTPGEAATDGAVDLVRMGARLASHAATTTYEIMGLEGMFNDDVHTTSFEGITLTSDPEFIPNVLGNAGVKRELSIDLMLQAMDLTSTRSDESVARILTGLGQRRKYFALLASDVRYAPGSFLGGYETLKFAQNAQVELTFDPHAQPNRMYFMPTNGIKKYELTPIGWGGFDANKMHWRENYDQATAFLRTYTNLGTEKRNALTLLEDLTEPAGYLW
ncbi:MAG: phage major capsid protein [bacterium]